MGLTLEQARKAIAASQAKAKEFNANVTTAVLDQAGKIIAMERMDRIGWITSDVAIGKAYACVVFNETSEAVGELATRLPMLVSSLVTMSGGHMVPSKGGVPIKINGELVGGIGVSGATAEQDVDCAVAGAAAVA